MLAATVTDGSTPHFCGGSTLPRGRSTSHTHRLFGNDDRVIFPYAALTLLVAGAAMLRVRRGEAIY